MTIIRPPQRGQGQGRTCGSNTVCTYGTAYKLRAMGTLIGLGVNLPEDAIYPASFVDGGSRPYSGANRYVLHFDKAKLPPAGAFWSVTLYDKDGFQVPNALNRFAIGDRDQLKFSADGSLDIYIQSESPGAELAACAQGRVQPRYAALLAEA